MEPIIDYAKCEAIGVKPKTVLDRMERGIPEADWYLNKKEYGLKYPRRLVYETKDGEKITTKDIVESTGLTRENAQIRIRKANNLKKLYGIWTPREKLLGCYDGRSGKYEYVKRERDPHRLLKISGMSWEQLQEWYSWVDKKSGNWMYVLKDLMGALSISDVRPIIDALEGHHDL